MLFFHLKFDSMNNSHLLEEGGFAALAGPQQQQLHLTSERLTILLQHPIDLLALVSLLDLLGAEFESQATSTRPR